MNICVNTNICIVRPCLTETVRLPVKPYKLFARCCSPRQFRLQNNHLSNTLVHEKSLKTPEINTV